MKDLVKFEFEGKGVRAGVDESGEPFWIGKDVCESLGFKSHNKTLSRLDDDEKGGVTIYHPTLGPREAITINEAGLYTLILRSNKPEAKKFRRWITHEVLPQLRRTGSYGLPQAAPEMVEVTDTILRWRRRCI
jgi:prophage antirepressor-like protein